MVTAKIRDILRTKGSAVYTIDPQKTVFDALQMMDNHGIGAVLVLEGDRPAGILSERDYARKVALKGKSSRNMTVQEIMSTTITTVTPENSVVEAMSIMTDKRIRHLPVIEGGRIVGMISIGDLVRRVIDEQREHIRHLENYITGQYMA